MGRRRVVVAVAGAGVVAAVGMGLLSLPVEQKSRAAETAPSAPAPADPLTDEEIGRAEALASAGSRQHMAMGRVGLLYVERDDDKDAGEAGEAGRPGTAGDTGSSGGPGSSGSSGGSGGRRLAEAYLYDYDTDTLIVRTVDLGTNRVVRETASRGVQPPPSKAEELRAAELLLAQPKLGDGVRLSYAGTAGRLLRSASDLGLRGLVFTPSQEGGAATQCAVHRCLRLFVRLPGGHWLDTSRIIVDLSAKKIHILEW
ncbi:hypothetical protein AB0395_20425 [Streptosporangium sp. NPDC051023]|uniref:hypothetical protein n=1 Tax=Streptosporangium sp. NPDC051023 TaxID=3155410 RepID=UPI00344F2EB1